MAKKYGQSLDYLDLPKPKPTIDKGRHGKARRDNKWRGFYSGMPNLNGNMVMGIYQTVYCKGE